MTTLVRSYIYSMHSSIHKVTTVGLNHIYEYFHCNQKETDHVL